MKQYQHLNQGAESRYTAPVAVQHTILSGGVLCQSDKTELSGNSEDYGWTDFITGGEL